MYGNIPSALKAWYQRGYKVAIISNQLGVGKGKVDKRSVSCSVPFNADTFFGVYPGDLQSGTAVDY